LQAAAWSGLSQIKAWAGGRTSLPDMTVRILNRLALAALLACLPAVLIPSAYAQQAKIVAEAAEDYALYCAACHGAEGRGDGELASKLVKPPSDLTGIAARHGEFPFWRVYAMVAGEEPVPGHDTFQMPQYAERMKADEEKPGYYPSHLRILLLTHYLESLQAE
jgi:mono/diheme cytochrome c family protein